MAKLIYITNVSLDGYIEDEQGRFDFSDPSDEQFSFITDLIRPVGTFLYGRGLYESMAVWETDPSLAEQSDLYAEFARVWQGAQKIVYSTTRDDAPTTKTRLERSFDPAALHELKAASAADLAIGGANLAASAFAAGLVDEVHLFISPVLLGGGKPALPRNRRLDLQLIEHRRFGDKVYVQYAVTP